MTQFEGGKEMKKTVITAFVISADVLYSACSVQGRISDDSSVTSKDMTESVERTNGENRLFHR